MKIREIVLLILTIVLDQFSKYYVASKVALHESVEVIRDFFYITHTRNTGAAWSMLEGFGVVFIILAGCVSAGIIYYLIKDKKLSEWERTAYIFVCGGAIGNMIDRIIHGYVIDFLNFYIFGYDYPVFNIADSFLVIGVFILIVKVVFNKE